MSTVRSQKLFDQIQRIESIRTKPEYVVLANAWENHTDACFFYLTGIPYGLFENSYLLAIDGSETTIFTTPLEAGSAIENADGMKVVVDDNDRSLLSKLRATIGNKRTIVGINSAELTMECYERMKSTLDNCEFVDIKDAVVAARAIKDDSEIANIRKACDITTRAYDSILSLLKEGMTENELAALVGYEMQGLGGSGVSFDTIVGFGPNSAKQHYKPGATKLKRGDLVIIDFGTRFNRYCSDLTRTLVFGRSNDQQKEIYSIVEEAHRVGIENCVESITGAEVHSRVANVIDSTKYRGRFIHSTGHGLGLVVHEGDTLSEKNQAKLKTGMVVTVEPGIYVPELGGVRLEDDILITKDRPVVLSSARRDLIEIP